MKLIDVLDCVSILEKDYGIDWDKKAPKTDKNMKKVIEFRKTQSDQFETTIYIVSENCKIVKSFEGRKGAANFLKLSTSAIGLHIKNCKPIKGYYIFSSEEFNNSYDEPEKHLKELKELKQANCKKMEKEKRKNKNAKNRRRN